MMMIANYGTVTNEYNTRGLFTPYFYGPIGFMHMYQNATMRVYGARIKIYSGLCSKTYSSFVKML